MQMPSEPVAQQLALIAREGVETYQGFLRAEPMSAEEFVRLARG